MTWNTTPTEDMPWRVFGGRVAHQATRTASGWWVCAHCGAPFLPSYNTIGFPAEPDRKKCAAWRRTLDERDRTA